MTNTEITDIVKKSFSTMIGHIPPECLNDTFIMDELFCISKPDFKVMRECIQRRTGVTIQFKRFEEATISDITNMILKKI